MKNTAVLFVALLIVLLNIKVFSAKIVEVLPLTETVLMLRIEDGKVNYHKKGQKRWEETFEGIRLDISTSTSTNLFSVSSNNDQSYSTPENPLKVYRKSKMIAATAIYDDKHIMGHWLYLQMPVRFKPGKNYSLKANLANLEMQTEAFTFDELAVRSEAIHVNLIGYEPDSKSKFAYVYQWLGDGGPMEFKGLEEKTFQLIGSKTLKEEFSGPIRFRAGADNVESEKVEGKLKNFHGSLVYECDFSKFKTPGEYFISIKGIGRSYPFVIADSAYHLPFFYSMKGLYHNRSGLELKQPFTDYIRPAPHNPLLTPGFKGKLKYSRTNYFDLKDYDNNAEDRPTIEKGYLGTLAGFGWYQDAGDWDAYLTHTKIPVMLLYLADFGQGIYKDNELNIPESGNGIPDIMDEGAWLLRCYHRLRKEITEKKWGTGGVPGSRIMGDLWGGDTRADESTKPSYEDIERDWYVTGEDPWITFRYAGMAAQMAFLLEKTGKKDPEKVDWKKEAISSYTWAKNKLKTTKILDQKKWFDMVAMRMHAAGSLYRLTKDQKYRSDFEKDFKSDSLTIRTFPSEDQQFAIWAYLLASKSLPTDKEILKTSIQIVKNAADNVSTNVTPKRAHRWGGYYNYPLGIGHGSTPQVFSAVFGYLWFKDFDKTLAQNYLGTLFTTSDYFLGTNPLNMTWITGVGEKYPSQAFYMDGWYKNTPEMPKGIIPYGPTSYSMSWIPGPKLPFSTQFGLASVYPALELWPGHELWFNQRYDPPASEFTVHQTTVMSAFVYGFLDLIPKLQGAKK